MRTSEQPGSFVPALGWTLVVILVVGTTNFLLGRVSVQNLTAPYSFIAYWVPVVVGVVITFVLARRGRYRLDTIGWLLTLAPLGIPLVALALYLFVDPKLDGLVRFTPYLFWFVVFWRRDRQIRMAVKLHAPDVTSDGLAS